MESSLDIAVVGAGPAGLSAAINAIYRGKSVRVFYSEDNYLSKAESVNNYLGLYDITGKQLMDQYIKHANFLGITPEKGIVANIMPMDKEFMINFNGDIITAKAVVIATGISRQKEIPGESKLLGKGVSYCATCDGMLYRGKKVLVWGHADDSAKEAKFLNDIGIDVTFIGHKKFSSSLDEDIEFINGAVSSVLGDNKFEGAMVGNQLIKADALFILRSSIAPKSLLNDIEIENGYIKVDRFMQTNIPGLFAAGDCTGKPLQVSKSVGEGLIAAQQAAKYIDEIKSQTVSSNTQSK